MHAARKHARKQPRSPSLLTMMTGNLGLQDRNPEQGREQHGDDPRHDQRHRDHHEQGEGEFTGVAGVETDRDEPGDGHQRPGEHRKGGRRVDVGRRLLEAIANFQTRHHHFDSDHCVIDQKAKRNDQCAERNTLQRNSGIRHDDEGDREHQRDRDRNDETGPKSKAEKADSENNNYRLEKRFRESRYSLLDDHWLIRHQMDPNPDRQVGQDLRHFLLQGLAELQEVCTCFHPDRECDGWLAVEANQGRRRIGVAACDGGNIGQGKKAIVDPKIDAFQVCLRRKLAVDAHADALRSRPGTRRRA